MRTVANLQVVFNENGRFFWLFLIVCNLYSTPVVAAPNILWFVVDDMSANFGCYGESLIETPNVDRLAQNGTRFINAFVTAPVCSPCRSAMITGMYQTSINAHHHRSGRGELTIQLPDTVIPIPILFQKAGYFTCIGSGLPGIDERGMPTTRQGKGKTDYNFQWDPTMYDSHDWGDRKPGQPFFMQVQLSGGKLRGNSKQTAERISQRAAREFGTAVDPNDVQLPPYYPRDPVLLYDWAAYLDSVRLTDLHVGRVIERLEKEGLLENTIVLFMTDHGISHARGKQFLYDEGTRIPFIVTGPGIPKGATRTDLVEHIDMAAISLAAAEIPKPTPMQAQDVFDSSYQFRKAIFAARDRCDETVDRIRSMRTDEYLYIRNYYPERPYLLPNAYKDGKSIIQKIRELHHDAKLDSLAERLLFSPARPTEELYRWKEDRWQTQDLSGDPNQQANLEAMRRKLEHWVNETNDCGPESDAMYDSDMAVYLREKKSDALSILQSNIEQMKRWAREGK